VRKRARFKYTVDDKGVDWVKGEIGRRMGRAFEPVRPFTFTSNGDEFGWHRNSNGRFNYTLYVESGRVIDLPGKAIMSGLRAIAHAHHGDFRITPNQNVIIGDVDPEDKPRIDALLAEHGLSEANVQSALRLNSIACVAMPTCPLAMAEAERYLGDFLTRTEALLAEHGLTDEPITVRISGCPNGCARPYISEIALTGRAPGKYNLYIGGGFHGERLNTLIRENIGEAAILELLGDQFGKFAANRQPGEHFGDFVHRAGALAAA